MVDIFICGLGSYEYDLQRDIKEVQVSDVIKFIEKKCDITEPRMIYKISRKYTNPEDRTKIIKGAKMNIIYNPKKAIYVKYNDDWIKDGRSFKNFYDDLESDSINNTIDEYQLISVLKERIKTYLKIEEEIELLYMNMKPINESLMICDVLGGRQDVIVRLKYQKHITIVTGEQKLAEIADMIRNGRYYGSSKKAKFQRYSIDYSGDAGGIKTKLHTYICRRNSKKDEDIKRMKYHDNQIARLLDSYPEFNWLDKYELYKVIEWNDDMGALYFKLIKTPKL